METPAVPAETRGSNQPTINGDLFADVLAELLQHEERMRPALEEIARELLPVRTAMVQLCANLAPYLREAAKALHAMAPALVGLVRAAEGAEARTANALRVLAQHGWHVDPGMLPSEVFERADEFSTGRADGAHAWLRANFDARLEEIEAMLCDKSPGRAKFFRSALAAHRRGDYASSIPLLLAQADGLCWDITQEQLYARRDGRPKFAARIAFKEGTTLRSSILIALLEPAPISASTKERVHLPDCLNRHVVLHGESLDYDTAVNSARAISLVTFVAWGVARVGRGRAGSAMNSSICPEGTPPAVTGVDASEFIVRFTHDKIVFIPKYSDTHTTFHLGPTTRQFDLHETRQSDGDHRTLFTLPHANLTALVEEVQEPFLAALRGLSLPLRPGRMVRNYVGAVLGLSPQGAGWATVTRVRKKALTIDPEKLKAQVCAPEYLDELYALADGEAFTLFSCRPGHSPHAIGLGFKYTDEIGRPRLVWFKCRRAAEVMRRVGRLLTAAGKRHGNVHAAAGKA